MEDYPRVSRRALPIFYTVFQITDLQYSNISKPQIDRFRIRYLAYLIAGRDALDAAARASRARREDAACWGRH